jgi:hypothetical protein
MTITRKRIPATVRFWPRVRKTQGCWLWTGGNNGKYGVFFNGQRKVYAHRFAYEDPIGPIPQGLQLDHLCRTPLCVRPDHLEPVTARVNQRRGLKGTQTHCLRGHPFDEANTIIRSNGTRRCRACARLRDEARGRYRPKPAVTHCLRGHEYTLENTRRKANGTRECRTCRQMFGHKPRPKVQSSR